MKVGLKERILRAKSEKEIDKLLEEGKNYELASPSTTRKWGRVAQKVLVELGIPRKKKKSKKIEKK